MPFRLFGRSYANLRWFEQNQITNPNFRHGFSIYLNYGMGWTPRVPLTGGATPYIWFDPSDYTQVWIIDHVAYPGALALPTDTSGTCSKVLNKGSFSTYLSNGGSGDCPAWQLNLQGLGGGLTRAGGGVHNYFVYNTNPLFSGDFTYIKVIAVPAAGIGGVYLCRFVNGYAGHCASAFIQTSTTTLDLWDDSANNATITHSALDTNWHILILRRTGSNVSRWLDGVSDGSCVLSGNIAPNFQNTGGGFMDYMTETDGEEIWYNSYVSDIDVTNSIMPYLKTRYKI